MNNLSIYKTTLVVTVIGISLQGCHSSSKDDKQTATPPPGGSTVLTLGTTQVIARTQVSSEVDDPLEVNSGAVVVTDSNEDIADPAIVNP